MEGPFLRRVYSTSGIVSAFGAALLLQRSLPYAALSLAWGATASLLSLLLTDIGVRRATAPGAGDYRRLMKFVWLKIGGLTLFIVATIGAAVNGWLLPLWVLVGFALPHLIILLKCAGLAITGASAATGRREPAPSRAMGETTPPAAPAGGGD